MDADEEFNPEELRADNASYYRMLGQFCSLTPASSNKRSADEMEAVTSQETTVKKLCVTSSCLSSVSADESLNLLLLPVEVLENILSFTDYSDLSKIRMVGLFFFSLILK